MAEGEEEEAGEEAEVEEAEADAEEQVNFVATATPYRPPSRPLYSAEETFCSTK